MNAWEHLLDAARNERWDYILQTDALIRDRASLTPEDATTIMSYLIQRYRFAFDEPVEQRAVIERLLEHTQTRFEDYCNATAHLASPEFEHWRVWFEQPIADWYALRTAARLRRFQDNIHIPSVVQSLPETIAPENAHAVLQFLYDRWTLAFDDASEQRPLIEAILRFAPIRLHHAVGVTAAAEWIDAIRA